MAIKFINRGPKDSILTSRGWVHERTGEMLVSLKVTPKQLEEYYGIPSEVPVLLTAATCNKCGDPNCDCGGNCDCEKMDLGKKTKKELLEVAKLNDVVIDSKDTKKTLIAKLSPLFE